MKIRHYPGKAVVNDPAWLEMDIPNSTRGLQYEANWLDTQRDLTASSSSTTSNNNWDIVNNQSMTKKKKKNGHDLNKLTSKLGKYQNLLNGNGLIIDDTSNSSRRTSSSGSLRLKYHSDKYLALTNKSKRDNSYSFYNNDEEGEDDDDDHDGGGGDYDNRDNQIKTNQSRAILSQSDNKKEQFRNVINDLEKQIKKSVRFNDKSTEISYGTDYDDNDDVDIDTSKKEVLPNNEVSEEKTQTLIMVNEEKREKVIEESYVETDKLTVKEEELTQERINDWIDDQNKYIVTIEDDDDDDDEKKNSLNRNDSGYYENVTKRARQRFPPQNIYKNSDNSTTTTTTSKSDSDVSLLYEEGKDEYDEELVDDYNDNDDVYKIYKNGHTSSPIKNNRDQQNENDLIRNVNNNINSNNNNNNRMVQIVKCQRANNNCDSNDFCIPRPKLIVPVHSYGVRKRRTGNIQRRDSFGDDNNTNNNDISSLYTNFNKVNKIATGMYIINILFLESIYERILKVMWVILKKTNLLP